MKRSTTSKVDEAELRERVVDLLTGGGAHATAEDSFARIPPAARGKKPRGSPHTPWELLEHLRIAQKDILDYAIEPAPRALEWPKDFWPPTPAPPDARAWSKSVKRFLADRDELVALVRDAKRDLTAPIPHAPDTNVLLQIFLAASHNSYHVGQLLLVARMLGA